MQRTSWTSSWTLLASVALLGSVPALAEDGVCSPARAAADLCKVTSSGFVVEALTGPGGEFPVLDGDGNSVFAYLITGPGVGGGSCQGVHGISHVSLLLSALCAADSLGVVDADPAPEFQEPGQGDPSCGFGIGDMESRLFKWDEGVGCNDSAIYRLVVAGAVPAQPTSLSIKAGPHCESFEILGPGCRNVVRYCPSSPNSTGEPGSLEIDASFSIAENQFTLSATNLPPGQPGFFFFGSEQLEQPFGDGVRCVGGKVSRLRKVAIEVDGTADVHLDLTQPPLDTIEPGTPYYFQFFYRDPQGGGQGYNTTDAICVVFTP